MSQRAEQVSRDIFPVPPKARRFSKRQLVRKRRREARRNPEGAIRRQRYDGWYW